MKLKYIVKLPSVEAAPLLLGCILSRHTPEGVLSIRIVETEAYHQDDPASHAFSGLTNRTAPMFQEGGHIYVYFTYGMHYCLNIVVGQKGVGEGVLLRAGEPLEGIEIMKKHRYTYVKGPSSHIDTSEKDQNKHVRGRTFHISKNSREEIINLTNGPAKLTQALGIISTELSGKKLGPKTLQLTFPTEEIANEDIVTSRRIGIKRATDKPWRFYIRHNPFVSKI